MPELRVHPGAQLAGQIQRTDVMLLSFRIFGQMPNDPTVDEVVSTLHRGQVAFDFFEAFAFIQAGRKSRSQLHLNAETMAQLAAFAADAWVSMGGAEVWAELGGGGQ